MSRRNLIIVTAVILLVLLPVAWWLGSPLFIDNTVDEAFPFTVPNDAEIDGMDGAEAAAVGERLMTEMQRADLSERQIDALQEPVERIAAKMPDHEMDEEMPAATAEWVQAARASFVDADAFHRGSGTATIYRQGAEQVLRLEQFMVTNGPDLHVLLVANIDGTDSSSIGEHVDLGSLKGNVGDQNYPIPADVDLTQYSGVMIYCMPFHVVFATAAFDG